MRTGRAGRRRRLPFVAIALLLLFQPVARAQTLVVKGSDTLGSELVPRLAAEFQSLNPEFRFEIASEGSSTGIISVLEGGADLAMASRALSPRERELAAERGRELRMFPVALDAIVVIVHPSNPVEDLSLRQVEALFCGDVANWLAVGGEKAGPIYPYTRHTASGTYSRFKELAMRKRDYSLRSQKMAGNEQIVMEVEQNPFGVGYVPLQEAGTGAVRVCALDGVVPSRRTMLDGRYRLLRRLYFIYDRGEADGFLRRFLAFCRSPQGRKIILSSRFIPYLSDEDKQGA